jgi:3-oxoacyl-[acyl-carrier protein] reductase
MTRKALVTGGSGGIGAAIATRLARDGVHVWIHYLNSRERAEQAAARIRDSGGQASLVRFDVSSWEDCSAALDKLLDVEQAMDIVVHNAGIADDAPLLGMKEAQWKRVIDTSLNSFFHVVRPLLMPMVRKRWGRVISISSVAALHGNRGQANYAAAKAGLIGASRSLAKELASRGVCVNVIAPGFIDTGMIAEIPHEAIDTAVAMKRSGKPEEVAEVAAFLCSDGASYITGDVLNVSGGIL